MSLITLRGFFSYAHADDEDGRLRELRDDLCREYGMLTAGDLDLFIDRDDLAWGSMWRKNIESGIDSSYFFIPVLTPHYFSSPNCAVELRQFLDKINKNPGSALLMLPILYVDVAREYLSIDEEIVQVVLQYQYEDWTKLRFEDKCSKEYRLAVNRMAKRLIDSNRAISDKYEASEGEPVNISSVNNTINSMPEETDEEAESDDLPDSKALTSERHYLFDDMVSSTEAFASIGEHLNTASDKLNKISLLFSDATNQINKEKGNSGRTNIKNINNIVCSLSARLMPVANEYSNEIDEYSSTVFEMDSSIRFLIQNAKNTEDDSAAQFASSMDDLLNTTKTAKANTQAALDKISVLANYSRSLSRPVSIIEKSYRKCLEAFDVILGWGELLDEES